MAKSQDESNASERAGWQVSRTFLKFWDILMIFIFGFIILLVIIRIVIGSISRISPARMLFMEESYEEPSEASPPLEAAISPIPEPTEAPQATSEPVYGEVTDKTMDTTDTKLGEIELSIPRLISPKSSNIISLSIYRPSKLASADPTTFLIVEIQNDNLKTVSSVYGELFQDHRTILIDERMKVEIVASAFDVERLFPRIQTVETEELEKPTRWAWSIIAPETEGVHIINFKVYVDEQSETPSWFGAYQIEVQQPVPTPSDTPIPSSEINDSQESDWTGIVDALKFFLDLLAVTSTIIGGVFAIIRPYIKRRVNQLEKIDIAESSTKTE